MSDKCPVCGNCIEKHELLPLQEYRVNCVRCGSYISDYYNLKHPIYPYKNENDIALLSGYIRMNNDVKIIENNYEDMFKKISMPSHEEKAKLILLSFKELDSNIGAEIKITEGHDNYYYILGKAFILNHEEWKFMIEDYLEKRNYIEFIKYVSVGSPRNTFIKISPKGLDYISTLQKPNKDSKTAFIAMWFDDEVKPTREVIKQAIRDTGYDPKIVDEEEHNDDVTDKIITMIKRARFVVADFTEQRAGVYYEAGYAKGLNIPVIHTVIKDEIAKLHFDINHQNFIAWENSKLEDFREKLKDRITETIGDGPLKGEN